MSALVSEVLCWIFKLSIVTPAILEMLQAKHESDSETKILSMLIDYWLVSHKLLASEHFSSFLICEVHKLQNEHHVVFYITWN